MQKRPVILRSLLIVAIPCAVAASHRLAKRSGLFFTCALFVQGSFAKEPCHIVCKRDLTMYQVSFSQEPCLCRALWQKSPDNLARLRIVSCMWHRAETNGQRSEWRVKAGTHFWRKQICLSEILSEYDCLSRPTQILVLVSRDVCPSRSKS